MKDGWWGCWRLHQLPFFQTELPQGKAEHALCRPTAKGSTVWRQKPFPANCPAVESTSERKHGASWWIQVHTLTWSALQQRVYLIFKQNMRNSYERRKIDQNLLQGRRQRVFEKYFKDVADVCKLMPPHSLVEGQAGRLCLWKEKVGIHVNSYTAPCWWLMPIARQRWGAWGGWTLGENGWQTGWG